MFAIGQSVEWGGLLEGTSVTLKKITLLPDSFTYQTPTRYIRRRRRIYGSRFVIDAIAQGHEAAESLHRRVRPDAHMTIGRDRRYYIGLTRADVKYPSYDDAGRQEPADKTLERAATLTEEQVKCELTLSFVRGILR